MSWNGCWYISYNGTNYDKFVKLSKLLIPNYIERFEENKANNSIDCTRELTWYTADVDIAKIMEYLGDDDTLNVSIDGETKSVVIDEDGEEKELEYEEQTFRKENGVVIIDNEHPDENRYRSEELGLYDYLFHGNEEDVKTYISFITREIGLDDELMPIAQSILFEVFTNLGNTRIAEKFTSIETTKAFFEKMYEEQKELIDLVMAEQKDNEDIPQFIFDMNPKDIRKLGGVKTIAQLVDTLGEYEAKKALQILGYDVTKTVEIEEVVEAAPVVEQVTAQNEEIPFTYQRTIAEEDALNKFYKKILEKAEKGRLTENELKQMYTYIFDRDNGIVTAKKREMREIPYTIHYPDGKAIQRTRQENGKIATHIFFKDENGTLTIIPELCTQAEGNLYSGPYRASSSQGYAQTRKGSHTFDVHEWGFEGMNENGQVGRWDKHYRYVTIDNSQKLVKVFESEKYIDRPWSNLYHRNKDANGKQCIRLVDMAGNVHQIKEGGKVGEKGLKEKTYGPRGDYQLKVVYKNNEPVYAIFLGGYENEPNEFCTAEELRKCYTSHTGYLTGYGKSFGWEGNCFSYMQEIIDNFNETFMQGNFVPSKGKETLPKDEPSIADFAEELSTLTDQEKQAQQLLEQYAQQLPDKDKSH